LCFVFETRTAWLPTEVAVLNLSSSGFGLLAASQVEKTCFPTVFPSPNRTCLRIAAYWFATAVSSSGVVVPACARPNGYPVAFQRRNKGTHIPQRRESTTGSLLDCQMFLWIVDCFPVNCTTLAQLGHCASPTAAALVGYGLIRDV
jgi:hypothetical protein